MNCCLLFIVFLKINWTLGTVKRVRFVNEPGPGIDELGKTPLLPTLDELRKKPVLSTLDELNAKMTSSSNTEWYAFTHYQVLKPPTVFSYLTPKKRAPLTFPTYLVKLKDKV
eukprot:GHVL01027355.1.p1 GENE.GHVL01027355.1~~GHVL01027355.1.p1  ORF type:complete len:112 (+),score=1.83 GHVL01027355.1:52-387(+)